MGVYLIHTDPFIFPLFTRQDYPVIVRYATPSFVSLTYYVRLQGGQAVSGIGTGRKFGFVGKLRMAGGRGPRLNPGICRDACLTAWMAV